VIDPQGQVFLVKHSYVSGWHLPGGGVEAGETITQALARELREEGNIELGTPARLHGMYFNDRDSPRDHVALFVVRDFHQSAAPVPNHEIIAHGFFAPGDLPGDTTAGTRARIREVLGGAAAERAGGEMTGPTAASFLVVVTRIAYHPSLLISQSLVAHCRGGVSRRPEIQRSDHAMRQRPGPARRKAANDNVMPSKRRPARSAPDLSPTPHHDAPRARPEPFRIGLRPLLVAGFSGLILVALSGACLIGLAAIESSLREHSAASACSAGTWAGQGGTLGTRPIRRC
jgi:8-oxo-dGTP pyrophosphatase MutT (NUDIX family)